jgi:glyoxylase I family protein
VQFPVEHLGLAARNTVALKDWYVNTLGAQVVFADNSNPPTFFVRLTGGTMFEIYPSNTALPQTSDNKLAGLRHIALRVGSIESARAYLEARGVKFTELVKPAGGGGQVQFFQDCEGNLLHLVERPADTIFIA